MHPIDAGTERTRMSRQHGSRRADAASEIGKLVKLPRLFDSVEKMSGGSVSRQPDDGFSGPDRLERRLRAIEIRPFEEENRPHRHGRRSSTHAKAINAKGAFVPGWGQARQRDGRPQDERGTIRPQLQAGGKRFGHPSRVSFPHVQHIDGNQRAAPGCERSGVGGLPCPVRSGHDRRTTAYLFGTRVQGQVAAAP